MSDPRIQELIEICACFAEQHAVHVRSARQAIARIQSLEKIVKTLAQLLAGPSTPDSQSLAAELYAQSCRAEFQIDEPELYRVLARLESDQERVEAAIATLRSAGDEPV